MLGEPYEDVGSASRFATKSRDSFGRLMADLTSGAFDADVLQIWENSRGSRTPREWLDLIEVCWKSGVKILITTHGRRGLYDLSEWRDRHVLQEESLKTAAASEETSERVMRALNANVKDGKPQGQIPFGYMREYARVRSDRGRSAMRPVAQVPDPAAALLIIELFQRIKAGDAFLAISRDWKTRGIRNKSDRPFSAQHLRSMAARKAYVGIRVHGDEEIKASWPVIADFENSPMTAETFTALFDEVQKILADPKRKTRKPGAAAHAYSMTIRCGICSGPMRVIYQAAGKRPEYSCKDHGCTKTDKAATDKVITAEIVNYLAQPEIYHSVTPEDGGAELGTVRAQLAVKRADLQEMRDAPKPKKLTAVLLLADSIDDLEKEIAALERRETKLTPGPSAIGALFDYGPDVALRWAATPIPRQRRIAQLLLTPDALGEVRIMRAVGTESAADRIKWEVED